jgi:hypothetical protein
MKYAEQTHTLEVYCSRLGFVIKKPAPAPACPHCFHEKTDQLHILEKQELYFFPQKKSSITVQLPWLLPEEQEYWNKQINKHYKQCGCGYGAAFLLLGGILLLLDLFLHGIYRLGIFMYLIAASLFLCLSAVTGKFIGIIWHRFQLRKVVSRLSKSTIYTRP